MNKSCDVPVLVVGAGPVGATLANLLGTYGVGTLLVDRSPAILEYPRAVGLDDEAMRTFQAAGLAEAMLRDMIQNVPMRMYGARKQCFAEILPATREFGWYRRNLFSQPLGEQTLRAGLARFPTSRWSWAWNWWRWSRTRAASPRRCVAKTAANERCAPPTCWPPTAAAAPCAKGCSSCPSAARPTPTNGW